MNDKEEMTGNLRERMAEAKKYQLLAWKALLPEQALQHLEICGRELTALLMECVLGGLAGQMNENKSADGDMGNTEGKGPIQRREGMVKKDMTEKVVAKKSTVKKVRIE